MKFVLRNIRLGSRIEGVYRQDMYELPPDGIRELIVNAVMNCSYIQDSRIQVAIYDDRLEITSPGGLLPGVTIDLMKEGFSKIRNRSLANAFAYMNLVEAWGSGIPKLMDAMKTYGLREPEFKDMDVAFRINLYRSQIDANNAENNANGIDGVKDGVNVASNREENSIQKLLRMIVENPTATQTWYAERLGVSKRTVSRMFASLQGQGIVEQKGTRRKARWALREEK